MRLSRCQFLHIPLLFCSVPLLPRVDDGHQHFIHCALSLVLNVFIYYYLRTKILKVSIFANIFSNIFRPLHPAINPLLLGIIFSYYIPVKLHSSCFYSIDQQSLVYTIDCIYGFLPHVAIYINFLT